MLQPGAWAEAHTQGLLPLLPALGVFQPPPRPQPHH
jgi:hypothetical protein